MPRLAQTGWPSDSSVYVSAAQVAARLGYRCVKTFYNARAGELKNKGFPKPALSRRWRASQIERWETFNEAGLTPAPANDPAPARTPRLATPQQSPARQRLDAMQRRLSLKA